MSKYIFMVLSAMGEVITGYDQPSIAKHVFKPTEPENDVSALKGDWNNIGNDFRKSAGALIGNHV